MKKLIFILILLLSLTIVYGLATEEILNNKESYETPGYNITLLGISENEKEVILCVNNEKSIIKKDYKTEFGGLKIKITRIYEDYIKIKIYPCDGCICDESCLNKECFPNQEIIEEEIETREEEIKETQEIPNTTIQEIIKKNTNGITITSTVLIIISLILLIIFFIKKKR